MFRFKCRKPGFASRTYTDIRPSKYLKPFHDLPAVKSLHRSPVSQPLVIDDLYEFDHQPPPRPTNIFYRRALSLTLSQFTLPRKERPYHLNDIFKLDLNIWSKSPGLPWKTHGYHKKSQIRDDPKAIASIRKYLHEVKTKQRTHKEFPECCAFVRSHICDKSDTKVRAVWGYPATITFAEAQFAIPLIQAYSARPGPFAYGYEAGAGGFSKLIDRFLLPDKIYYGLDFKKFDKTVPYWLIRDAFRILKLQIDFTKYRERGTPHVKGLIYLFQQLEEYFINTRIRAANGSVFEKFSGIASGSYFTQLIGSIVNAIVMNYILLASSGSSMYDGVFQGDDSLFSADVDVDLDKLNHVLQSVFGMELNMKKSHKADNLNDIHFLGYKINYGHPLKEEGELFASLLFPETPDTSWDDVASRAVGVYYASFGHHDRLSRVCLRIINARKFD